MRKSLYLLIVVSAFGSLAVNAQEEKRDIFANPQNLKALPSEISSKELSDTMRGFAMGLGVRCETCHVGESGQPLHTFDFESDEKEMKRKARVMIVMLADINSDYVPQLNKIDDADRVEVRCVTCHRGRPQPNLIEDELDEQLADAGLEAALARYEELRENYFGSHSYDFSEFTLPMYAQQLAAREQVTAAIAMLQLNVPNFPESYYTQFVLGELNNSDGNDEAALDAYTRAIELNPRAARFIQAKIDTINKK